MKLLARFRKAAALPLVLLLVAFNVTVLVALLLLATTELNASRNSVSTNTARVMALNGIELAGALIAENSTNNAYVSYQNIITNLPGDTNARLETKIANTVTQGNQWTRIVDSQTALHSGFAASNDEKADLNYAVPSSTNAGDTISGYILPRTNPTNSNWRNLHTNMFQMKWVNVYKGPTSEPTNLIGRFAFWVDDESTKLNVNYAGTHLMYDPTTFSKSYHTPMYLLSGRFPWANRADTNRSGQAFDGNDWPVFMELGGASGITRSNAYNILLKRGLPNLFDSSPKFFAHYPYYSLLEARTGDTNALKTISQQSQFGFTATMFSREPELSIAKGIPRFDMFEFSRDWAPTRMSQVSDKFTAAITNNYPKFWDKYNFPQFVAAINSIYQIPNDDDNAVTNFPYIQARNENTNYNARSLPLINETEIKLLTYLQFVTNNSGTTPVITTNSILSLRAAVELINLNSSSDGTTVYTIFNELHMAGSKYAKNATGQPLQPRYRARVEFSPEIEVNGVRAGAIELTPESLPSSNNWFADASIANGNTNSLRIQDQNLTGCFAVLRGSTNWTNSGVASNISWGISPNSTNTITSKVYYRKTTNDILTTKGLYQTVNAQFSWLDVSTVTNSVTYNGTNALGIFHIVSHPRADSGIRADPRLGLHGLSPLSPQYLTNGSQLNTNTSVNNFDSTIGKLNKTWTDTTDNSGPNFTDFLNEKMSPDITSAYTVFESDRGIPMIPGQLSFTAGIPNNSAIIGEIPITTHKASRHLAWSTPRLWGDGRTNLDDGNDYPPDWLMLDCIHTALLPYNNKPVFVTSTNDYISYGRLNINGLKTYFQQPKSPKTNSDTVVDSVLIHSKTKDFTDYYNPGSTYPDPPNTGGRLKWVDPAYTDRTVILDFINSNAVARGSSNRPYMTPYEFTAEFAGNTNFLSLTNYWEAYVPGATNTSDRRLESMVRSLQQRLTSRGWQFTVFSLGQSLQVIKNGSSYKTNVVGEAYMQSVWERAPKHANDGTIANASPGGAPPMRMLYMREIR
jgi:hypothetical protein